MFFRKKVSRSILVLVFVWGFATLAGADQQRPDLSKQVGDRTPIFSLATSQDYLASYDRDYYGRHHLILTFFPAAFTPV